MNGRLILMKSASAATRGLRGPSFMELRKLLPEPQVTEVRTRPLSIELLCCVRTTETSKLKKKQKRLTPRHLTFRIPFSCYRPPGYASPYSGSRLWVPSQKGFDAAALQQHKA